MINEQDVTDYLEENEFLKIGSSDGKDMVFKINETIHTEVTILVMTGINKETGYFISKGNPSSVIAFFDTRKNIVIGKTIRHWYINKKDKEHEDSWYDLFPDSIEYYKDMAINDKLFRCKECKAYLKYIPTPPNQDNFWGCSRYKETGCNFKMYEDDITRRTQGSSLPQNINL